MEIPKRFFEGQTLAILTGGGDTPALNASIEALKCRASVLGYNIYGIREGWKGLLGDGDIVNLTGQPYDGWYGGTALRSSRTNPLATKKNPVSRVSQVIKNLKRYKIDVLVTIGGDDTNGAAKIIYEQEGIPVIGFPKTIDNDIRTRTFHLHKDQDIEACLCPGFPTAAKNIMEYTAKICTTAESHSRIIVLEIMGRDAGWLTGAASFGGANMALIPEYEMTEERIEKFYKKVIEVYKESPKKCLVIAVSEGTRWFSQLSKKVDVVCASSEIDEFGHPRFGGISSVIANEIEKRTGIQARGQITGYFARSGECSKYDKRFVNILADRVLDLLIRKDYGKMPVLGKLTNMVEIEEYNTFTIDMGQIENKSLPSGYYDPEKFDFNSSYMDFLGHILKKPRGFLFDYNFPKVQPFC